MDTMIAERFEDIDNPDIDRLPSMGHVSGGVFRARPTEQRAVARAAAIKAVVAKEYGVPVKRIDSNQRSRTVSEPRQAAMWLTAKTTQLSIPQIGRAFNRDHTTVLHALKAVEARMARDPVEAQMLNRLANFVQSQEFLTTENEALIAIITERVTDAVTDRLRKLAKMNGDELLRVLVPEYYPTRRAKPE